MDGRPVARVYRFYRFRSVVYLRYVPATRYDAQFYQWAGNPWRSRVAYAWGWGEAPWLAFQAGYFTPSPEYPSPALWLTDYVLAENLKTAYQNHQEYEQNPPNPAPATESTAQATTLTPEAKDAIAQQVQAEVTEEAEASTASGRVLPAPGSQAPPPVLDPQQRTFVVTQSLDVPQAGALCTLSPGDVIYRTADSPAPGNKVAVNVVASKAGDCPANSSTEVDLGTLQEMHNRFREQIDAGLGTLAASQGHDGLPSRPAASPRPDPEGTAKPDADVATTLAQQQNDADAAVGAAVDGANAVGTML